jgi:cobalt/nickel transport system ATP-binding protein
MRNHDHATATLPRADGGSSFRIPNSALRITSLCHTFAGGRRALDGVSFAVAEGECVALVGPNGAGKTTLFLRLCGVLSGRPGEATVAGLDPADPSQKKGLPAVVGVLFQNADDQLFSPTVRDDVAFGPLNLGLAEPEVNARVADALARVGLAGYEDRVPFQMSGGEKRRAALATLLAMRPSVYLLDEPTASLDPRGLREVIDLVRRLPGTKLIATHDPDFVLDCCPRVLVMDGGKLVADGRAEDVLADERLLDTHGLDKPRRLRG